MIRRICVTVRQFVSVLVLLSCLGCQTQSLHPSKRIGLRMEGAQGDSPTVAVSMKYSTGWVHMFAILDPNGKKHDKIEIQKIEFAAPGQESLYVPGDCSSMFWGSILTFVKSDFPGFAVFKPGCVPAVWGPDLQHGGGLDLKQAILRGRVGPGRAGSRGADRMSSPAAG